MKILCYIQDVKIYLSPLSTVLNVIWQWIMDDLHHVNSCWCLVNNTVLMKCSQTICYIICFQNFAKDTCQAYWLTDMSFKIPLLLILENCNNFCLHSLGTSTIFCGFSHWLFFKKYICKSPLCYWFVGINSLENIKLFSCVLSSTTESIPEWNSFF